MEENKTKNLAAIQDLIKHINYLKQDQVSLRKQYQNLSADFVPVTYRNKKFLDKIIPFRYKKFQKSYDESERKKRNLKNIDDNILLLQIEIEESEIFLYRLQNDMSHSISLPENSMEKSINNSNKEPSIDN